MVAGGGASVVYRYFMEVFFFYIKHFYQLESRHSTWTIHLLLLFSDTICDLGGVDELANYGEYSGAPSEQQTYDYAKTILSLMTREKHPEGGCSWHVI